MTARPVAIVTGGSAGIGWEIGQRLSADGYLVVATDRVPGLTAGENPAGVLWRELDVTDEHARPAQDELAPLVGEDDRDGVLRVAGHAFFSSWMGRNVVRQVIRGEFLREPSPRCERRNTGTGAIPTARFAEFTADPGHAGRAAGTAAARSSAFHGSVCAAIHACARSRYST